MQSARAFRTAGAWCLQTSKDSLRRCSMAHVTYSTARASESSPRRYSSAFLPAPDPWRFISASASETVSGVKFGALLSLRSFLSRGGSFRTDAGTESFVVSVVFVVGVLLGRAGRRGLASSAFFFGLFFSTIFR